MGLFKDVGHVLHKGVHLAGGLLGGAGAILNTVGTGLTLGGIADPLLAPVGVGTSALGYLASGAGMALNMGDRLGHELFSGHPDKKKKRDQRGRSVNTMPQPIRPPPGRNTSVVRAYKETPNQIIIDRNIGYRRGRSDNYNESGSTKKARTSSKSVKLDSINRISDI